MYGLKSTPIGSLLSSRFEWGRPADGGRFNPAPNPSSAPTSPTDCTPGTPLRVRSRIAASTEALGIATREGCVPGLEFPCDGGATFSSTILGCSCGGGGTLSLPICADCCGF